MNDDDDQPDLFDTPEAFENLAPEVIDAITDPATPEQVAGFVAVLRWHEPQHVEIVRRAIVNEPWFPSHNKHDTQLRWMRKVMASALAADHPVCSTNAGYFLGSWDEVLATARRASRQAHGCAVRAAALVRKAESMKQQSS